MVTISTRISFLSSIFSLMLLLFTKGGRKRLNENRTSLSISFVAGKKSLLFLRYRQMSSCVCNVRPANRYAIASFVYIKSHLLRTVRQERRRKRGCHDCHNYMERPTHGQGLYLPCPVAICQRKRGNKGNSGTDVSENLLFVVFFVFSKNIQN